MELSLVIAGICFLIISIPILLSKKGEKKKEEKKELIVPYMVPEGSTPVELASFAELESLLWKIHFTQTMAMCGIILTALGLAQSETYEELKKYTEENGKKMTDP